MLSFIYDAAFSFLESLPFSIGFSVALGALLYIWLKGLGGRVTLGALLIIGWGSAVLAASVVAVVRDMFESSNTAVAFTSLPNGSEFGVLLGVIFGGCVPAIILGWSSVGSDYNNTAPTSARIDESRAKRIAKTCSLVLGVLFLLAGSHYLEEAATKVPFIGSYLALNIVDTMPRLEIAPHAAESVVQWLIQDVLAIGLLIAVYFLLKRELSILRSRGISLAPFAASYIVAVCAAGAFTAIEYIFRHFELVSDSVSTQSLYKSSLTDFFEVSIPAGLRSGAVFGLAVGFAALFSYRRSKDHRADRSLQSKDDEEPGY